jgi:hypothetical protein
MFATIVGQRCGNPSSLVQIVTSRFAMTVSTLADASGDSDIEVGLFFSFLGSLRHSDANRWGLLVAWGKSHTNTNIDAIESLHNTILRIEPLPSIAVFPINNSCSNGYSRNSLIDIAPLEKNIKRSTDEPCITIIILSV